MTVRLPLLPVLGFLLAVAGPEAAPAADAVTFGGVPRVDPTIRADRFVNPSAQFRPIALWRINGEPTRENILRQLDDLHAAGFGSFMARSRDDGLFAPILERARELGLLAMWRDDTGYPSGGAGGRMERLHPRHLRKVLEKTEAAVSGNPYWKSFVPPGPLMAAVAMDMETLERIDLAPFITDGLLTWEVPKGGDWRVMFFNCVPATYWKRDMPVDYLDPEALERFRELTYDELAAGSARFFNDPIAWVQYDDVGFLAREKTWTPKFNEAFRRLQGFDPTLLYPALWYDIGPETAAARVAFFDTRSELLAEGYPRMVADWSRTHRVTTVGQPPGNYKDQPVDILGDAFEFFRHTDIPQTDAIIAYGNGLHGFKLTSSVADLHDRPVVMTEAYGAFPEETIDVRLLHRVPIELFARGGNFVMVHYGAWNHPDPVNMPYAVMGYPEGITRAFPAYNEFVGRACYLLTGGRTVADIAVLYPIDSLQAGFRFDAPEYVGRLRRGWWTYPEADYLTLSDLLTNELRRDFTFVHPDHLATDRYSVGEASLRLNTENFQDYGLVVIPGGRVISVEALRKIEAFHQAGGRVLATTLLPTVARERGRDAEVAAIVARLFGTDAATRPVLRSNARGGRALFVPEVDARRLARAVDSLLPAADVSFIRPPRAAGGLGHFSYLHKVRDGRDLYFFGNSSDHAIDTEVRLRGRFDKLESWDPHYGRIAPLGDLRHEERGGSPYTIARLRLPAVRSVFWIAP